MLGGNEARIAPKHLGLERLPGQPHLLAKRTCGQRQEPSGEAVALEAEEHCYLGASFYFNAQQPQRNERAIPEVARQMARWQRGALRETIVAAIEENPDIQRARLDAQFRTLVVKPLGTLTDAAPTLLIVLDALDESAEACTVSLLKLINTLCRSVVGVTPGEYIKNRILLEAKRLLYNSSLNVKEISYHLGFEDPSYFNRFFKKNLGMTAGEFRQNITQI